jgi:hypothetical protein
LGSFNNFAVSSYEFNSKPFGTPVSGLEITEKLLETNKEEKE